jgi:GH15 family glucan-1,4-alpha-glucosidase
MPAGARPPDGPWTPSSDDRNLQLAVAGERRRLFDRLAGVANDVGLLAEGYDPRSQRLVGNFPQAFSHVALINTAHDLGAGPSPARHRGAAR